MEKLLLLMSSEHIHEHYNRNYVIKVITAYIIDENMQAKLLLM